MPPLPQEATTTFLCVCLCLQKIAGGFPCQDSNQRNKTHIRPSVCLLRLGVRPGNSMQIFGAERLLPCHDGILGSFGISLQWDDRGC